MATIKPFKGLRPAAHAEKIACPPYDVLNSAEAREMAKGNSISFLHIDKPEIDLPENIDLYAPEVYQKAKENLDKFIHDRILVRDPKEYFYLYAQTMDGRTQYGLVAFNMIFCGKFIHREFCGDFGYFCADLFIIRVR